MPSQPDHIGSNDLDFLFSRSVAVILKSEDSTQFLRWFDQYAEDVAPIFSGSFRLALMGCAASGLFYHASFGIVLPCPVIISARVRCPNRSATPCVRAALETNTNTVVWPWNPARITSPI